VYNNTQGEWGTPKRDDRRLFEDLILDGAQAGLSWMTILRKRENYREAFDNFDPAKVAAYDETKIEELLGNAGIIRNQQKINSGSSAFCVKSRYLRPIQYSFSQ
jgi:DNA-3-methyladenine glycosylase I